MGLKEFINIIYKWSMMMCAVSAPAAAGTQAAKVTNARAGGEGAHRRHAE